MPRHLNLHNLAAAAAAMPPAAPSLGAVAAFLAACAVALAACASHSGGWRRLAAGVSRRWTEPVIFEHRVDADGEVPPPCIWQKNILMGEKCQLPEFSGVVAYDAAGNLVVPGRARAAPALGW